MVMKVVDWLSTHAVAFLTAAPKTNYSEQSLAEFRLYLQSLFEIASQ
jgi:hypothetical protein